MPELLALVREALQEGTSEAFEKVEAGLSLFKDGTPPAEVLTPVLFAAIKAESIQLVDMLLREGADPLLPDAKGIRPLHAATFTGNLDLLKLLVDAKAHPDACDPHGQTAMFFAPAREACNLLAEAKASINHRNSKGQSAMHLAAHSGLEDSVLWFVQHMSPGTVNAQDKHGRTALWCGQRAGHKSVVALLESHGASKRIQPHKVWKEHPFGATRLFPSQKKRVVPLAKGGDATLEAFWRTEEQLGTRSDTPTMRKLRDLEAAARAWTEDQQVADSCESPAQANSKSLAAAYDSADGCHRWEVLLERTHDAQSFGFACRNAKVSYSHALGLEHHEGPEMLVIARVGRGSLLDHWNQAHPTQQVVRGSRILMVNGASTIRTMQEQLAAKTVQLQVVRYLDCFQVVLPELPMATRAGLTCGIRFGLRVTSKSGDLLIVAVVRGGLLEAFNRDMAAKGLYHLVVCPGMRIEAVNEVEGNNKYMEAELQAAETLQLRLRRAEEVVATDSDWRPGTVSTNATRPSCRMRPREAQTTAELGPLLQAAPRAGTTAEAPERAAAEVEGLPVYRSQSSAGMAMDHSISSAVPTETVAGELLELIRESSRRWKEQRRDEDEEAEEQQLQLQQRGELESDAGSPEPDGAGGASSSLAPEPQGQQDGQGISISMAGDHVPEPAATEPSDTLATVNDPIPESAVPRVEEVQAPFIDLGTAPAAANNANAALEPPSDETGGTTAAGSDVAPQDGTGAITTAYLSHPSLPLPELVQQTEHNGTGAAASDPTAELSARSGDFSGMAMAAGDASPELVQATDQDDTPVVVGDPSPELIQPIEPYLMDAAESNPPPELLGPSEIELDGATLELREATPELTQPTEVEQDRQDELDGATDAASDHTPELTSPTNLAHREHLRRPEDMAIPWDDPTPEVSRSELLDQAQPDAPDQVVAPNDPPELAQPTEIADATGVATDPNPELVGPSEPDQVPPQGDDRDDAVDSPAPEVAQPAEQHVLPPGESVIATAMERNRPPELAQLTEPHVEATVPSSSSPEQGTDLHAATTVAGDFAPELSQEVEADQGPLIEPHNPTSTLNGTPELTEPDQAHGTGQDDASPELAPLMDADGQAAVAGHPTPEPDRTPTLAPDGAAAAAVAAHDSTPEQSQPAERDAATALASDPTPEVAEATAAPAVGPAPGIPGQAEPDRVQHMEQDGVTAMESGPTPELTRPAGRRLDARQPSGAGGLGDDPAPELAPPVEPGQLGVAALAGGLQGTGAASPGASAGNSPTPELSQPGEPDGAAAGPGDPAPELAELTEPEEAEPPLELRGRSAVARNSIPELTQPVEEAHHRPPPRAGPAGPGPEGRRTVVARDSLPELALPAEAYLAQPAQPVGTAAEEEDDVPELAEATGLGGGTEAAADDPSPESAHEFLGEAQEVEPDVATATSNDPTPESTVPLAGEDPAAVLSTVPDEPASSSSPEEPAAPPAAAAPEADPGGGGGGAGGLFPAASEENVMVDELLRRTAKRQHSTTFIAEDEEVVTEVDADVRTLEFEDAQNPCASWEVVLTKSTEEDRFGLAHVSAKEEFHRLRGGQQGQPGEGPEMLQIKRVADSGLLVQWNLEHPDGKVVPGDYIAEVNGARTIDEMQKQMRTSEVKMFIIRFPGDFHLRLRRDEDGQQLGMKYRPEVVDGMRLLRITALRPSGLLEAHNQFQISRSMHHLVVCTGMSIVAVNGMELSDEAAREALAGARTVELRVRRPPPAPENPALSARLSARHSVRDSTPSSAPSSNKSAGRLSASLVPADHGHASAAGGHAPQREDAAG